MDVKIEEECARDEIAHEKEWMRAHGMGDKEMQHAHDMHESMTHEMHAAFWTMMGASWNMRVTREVREMNAHPAWCPAR